MSPSPKQASEASVHTSSSDFPWSQFRTLTLSSVIEADDQPIQDILRQCTSLKDLVLESSVSDEDMVHQRALVLLPRFTSLVFGTSVSKLDYKRSPWIETPGLLASLRVPALESFSNPRLERHALGRILPPEGFEHIMSILESLPLLQKLDLHFCEETSGDLAPTEFD
ncbi:hypothetical protein BDV98DRAFT_598725 [Pterulicium gracile]|uniref:F-box domain-containing protein n=1 Tax=Pterulicium gracile TaxID=1884261 RepID=A0A5C3Q046_9AGAR|nr:hypothetical protein BDV98DRAFT_598725 [Pterula gracilis]